MTKEQKQQYNLMKAAANEGFKHYFTNIGNYIGITVVGFLALFINVFMPEFSEFGCVGMLIDLVFLAFFYVVIFWIDLSFFYSCGNRVLRHKNYSTWLSYKNTITMLPKFILLAMLIHFAQGLGYMLFIIPGIFITIAFIFAEIIFVIDGGNVGQSINKSSLLTKKRKGMFSIIFMAYIFPVALLITTNLISELTIKADLNILWVGVISAAFTFLFIITYLMGHAIMIHVYKALLTYDGVAAATEEATLQPPQIKEIDATPINP